MAYGEHHDYLAACELLTAGEIALILRQDANWTLPRGRGSERRMEEARALIEGPTMRTTIDLDPPVVTHEQITARERERLAAIVAMTGGSVPDVDNVSDQLRPEPDKEKLMPQGKPVPMMCVETDEVWPSVGQLHASLGDTIARSSLDSAIKAGKAIEGKTYKPATSDAPLSDVARKPISTAKTHQPRPRPPAPAGDDSKVDVAEFTKPEPAVVASIEQRPSSPVNGKDYDPAQLERTLNAEIADHRGRVRLVYVECDDCSAETVGSVLREMGKLFN